MGKIVAAVIAFGAAVAGVAGAASADPAGAPGSDVIELTCGGVTSDVVVNGRGAFTPAFDSGSAIVLIPVAFGSETVTIFDSEGNEVTTFVDDETVTKGHSPAAAAGRNVQDCTYALDDSFVATEEDAEGGLTPGDTYFVHVDGNVTGFASGRR